MNRVGLSGSFEPLFFIAIVGKRIFNFCGGYLMVFCLRAVTKLEGMNTKDPDFIFISFPRMLYQSLLNGQFRSRYSEWKSEVCRPVRFFVGYFPSWKVNLFLLFLQLFVVVYAGLAIWYILIVLRTVTQS